MQVLSTAAANARSCYGRACPLHIEFACTGDRKKRPHAASALTGWFCRQLPQREKWAASLPGKKRVTDPA